MFYIQDYWSSFYLDDKTEFNRIKINFLFIKSVAYFIKNTLVIRSKFLCDFNKLQKKLSLTNTQKILLL